MPKAPTKHPVDIYAWPVPMSNGDFIGEADLNPPVSPPWHEADSIVLEPAQREPSGPVGPIWGDRKPLCTPCGHTWSEHDDQGCLWNLCQCGEPGERQ